MFDRSRALGVLAAALILGAGTATTPAAADPVFSCTYRVFSWNGGFSADLWFTNGGPAINGWTVRMVFPGPASVGTVWNANIAQGSPVEMIATPMPWNTVISTGQFGTFGWTATSSVDGVPTTVSINGMSC
jgi:hypothetical protein